MTYSRFVRWLKLGLPLIALAILSAVFLLPKDRAFDGGLIYSTADLIALGEGMNVDNPRFTGTTEAGEPFVVAADNAVPDGPNPSQIVLARPRASIDQDDRSISLTAREGELRPKAHLLELSGDVRLDTTDGWQVRTNWVEADIKRGIVRAPGKVRAEGPQGAIEAGSFRAEQGGTGDLGAPAANQGLSSDARFWFENGVKVTYAPRPRGEAAGASETRGAEE
ncbi:LPS export ABC transporter periplasmic protein LptC [Rhodovulum sp. DZ06]|uniref:LPS export ABC transporter periplasmic protein LptC n=1 Tax=Rhodovulum sp. DZ06 TaxID=3425126 RepID=UPI003D33C94D